MTYYARLSSDNIIQGYYIEEFHGIEKCLSLEKYIKVDDELHDYLLTLSPAQLVGESKQDSYTIEDVSLFKRAKEEEVQFPPSEMDLLKEEVLQQSELMLDMDFRLTSLELGL